MSATKEKSVSRMKVSPYYWWKTLIFFGVWTFYGLFFALQAYINSAYVGRTVSFERTLVLWLSCGYVWAFLTPFVIRLAGLFPLEKGNLLRDCQEISQMS